MLYAEQHTVTLTTNGSGAATGYTPEITGEIRTISYVKTDFADGVDFTLTGETSGQQVWVQENVNASAVVHPRQQVHTVAGVAATYDGTRPILEPALLAGERLKIVVAAGGDTTMGTFIVVVG